MWDYPRPPAVVPDSRSIEIRASGDDHAVLIAASDRSVRVCETALPPSFYLPPESVVPGTLRTTVGTSQCEWKGRARYLAVASRARTDTPRASRSHAPTPSPRRSTDAPAVAWCYPDPYPEFADHAGWISFYPDRVACWVDGERVRAQDGGFYGGWITDDVVGPFKGAPGTSAW